MNLAKRVILILLDGLRPDGVLQAATPTIDRLAKTGAYSWQAQAVLPSLTLPCHASLFKSVPPSSHGVVDNDWIHEPADAFPSLIDVAHQASLGTAAIYSWEPLRDLARAGSLDFVYFSRPGKKVRRDFVQQMGAVAAAHITKQRPAFTFVYFASPDLAGHNAGWMSEHYLATITFVDEIVGQLLARLEAAELLAETACLLLADHGGHGKVHGTACAEDLRIPWLLSGPGVRRGYDLPCAVNIIDTAPTVAYLLGLPQPEVWEGRVVTEAFEKLVTDES